MEILLYSYTFSVGQAGASTTSPNDAHWATLSQKLSRLISVPLLTAVLSRTQEEQGRSAK